MSRLVLVAPGCDPDDVGEAWVVYQWVYALAGRHEVTLLTYRKRDRPPVAESLRGRARVVEWTDPPLVGRVERLNSMLKPGYGPFYVRARRWLRQALASGERFDLGHQIAPVAVRYPTPFQGLGIPYLIGPSGGSLPTPDGFRDEVSEPWFVGLRAADRVRLAHDPLLRRSYEGAACVLGVAPYMQDVLSGLQLQRFEVMGDTGIAGMPASVERPVGRAPVRLLFVGRLVRTKGARDAVAAMAHLRDLQVHLDVVGRGADEQACRDLAAALGVSDRVTFHGQLPRSEVSARYDGADVFLFPSFREPGGLSVVEAMSHGLPCVVSSRGGPGCSVDDTCGVRVEPTTPTRYAQDLADEVRQLVLDEAGRAELGRGARARAAEVGLWEHKIERVEQIYREVLARDVAARVARP